MLLYRFEDFALDTDRRELRCRDGLLPVEPQVSDLQAPAMSASGRYRALVECQIPAINGRSKYAEELPQSRH
jgi:hypothetical protein